MLNIGTLRLTLPYILAPLSGISDLPFRMLNRAFGCELAFTEMVSSQALVYQSKHTQTMLATNPADKPLGVQLVGSDVGTIQKAMDRINTLGFDIVDFNAACPVNKVTAKGKGASLLKEPRKLQAILKVMVRNSMAPVTVKIRSGWDNASINAKEIALYAQDAGISALFIHGRTRTQQYSGNVDYQVIREVKAALKIPVIASGDALSPHLIKKMSDETGCDGVVIARGALGNPWIFKETSEFLKTGIALQRPELKELTTTMLRHLDLYCEAHGEGKAVTIFRKFFGWYTKRIPDIKPLKEMAFHAKTKEQMTGLIHKALSRNSML